MAERTDGLHRAITYPLFYKGLMYAFGADKALSRYASILDAKPGCRMLDVGCGPANILAYLPEVQYTGIDLNPRHIEFAKKRYNCSTNFLVGDVTKTDFGGQFDLINLSGVLHHLDDADAKRLLNHLGGLLGENGRIVTLDNVWLPKQRLAVKILNSLDSGQNIRSPEQYMTLFSSAGLRLQTRVTSDLLRVPYDHFIVVATR
ncbi:class I SAM-dependent methyltransferase [Nitrobacter sp.]|uniref:class I SAM-dependent methyltransferase n=1 Tax=Nitrobacter sp. TaxID=29420 RepID=UPI0029CAB5C7|nr:class I SAM-dependent methyltransferase [Nitrobacter sp.]